FRWRKFALKLNTCKRCWTIGGVPLVRLAASHLIPLAAAPARKAAAHPMGGATSTGVRLVGGVAPPPTGGSLRLHLGLRCSR
ncbi:hypothetical protein KI387_000068, partial [Taxus chinensis]